MMSPLCERVIHALLERGQTLATAESLTGGGIGAALTAVPGASAVYHGGVVSYVNDVKHRILGVSREDLDRVGAVSAPVALAMAKGVRDLIGTDYAISVTGLPGMTSATSWVRCLWVWRARQGSGWRNVISLAPGSRFASRPSRRPWNCCCIVCDKLEALESIQNRLINDNLRKKSHRFNTVRFLLFTYFEFDLPKAGQSANEDVGDIKGHQAQDYRGDAQHQTGGGEFLPKFPHTQQQNQHRIHCRNHS